MPIHQDHRGVAEAARVIFEQPGLADRVLRDPSADRRLRERLALMVELERQHGRQITIFDDPRRYRALGR